MNDIFRQIYFKLQDLQSTLVSRHHIMVSLYFISKTIKSCEWISTKLMLADEASRRTGFLEEFVPQHIFQAIIEFLSIQPTIDGCAKMANKKLDRYCSRFDIFEKPTFVNFPCLNPNILIKEIWYLFPPRPILPKIVNLICHHKLVTLLVFHIWREIPACVTPLFCKPNKILKFDSTTRITLIPAEKNILVDSRKLQGFFNHSIEATYVIYTNPIGPFPHHLFEKRFNF